ncbi:MAG TPA: DUF2281 domain-containing protein [Vicinamibacteria bacterium]|nr:DUF2281 domain-containing protein [Vicinamibacteria bacterium]
MTTADLIAQKTSALSPERQQEVLDFVEFLEVREARRPPLCSVEGLWRGLDLSSGDIEEARRELWGSFPRTGL